MVLAAFETNGFDPSSYNVGILAPGSTWPLSVRTGIPINAYKQFKYIDSSGHTYYAPKGLGAME